MSDQRTEGIGCEVVVVGIIIAVAIVSAAAKIAEAIRSVNP